MAFPSIQRIGETAPGHVEQGGSIIVAADVHKRGSIGLCMCAYARNRYASRETLASGVLWDVLRAMEALQSGLCIFWC